MQNARDLGKEERIVKGTANNKSRPVVFYATMLLFLLTMITTSMTSGLYARYTTAASGEDSARVAAFSIQSEGELSQSFSLSLLPGGDTSKAIEITYSGEVAVRYVLTVESTGNLPLTFSIDGQTAAKQSNQITVKLSPGTHTKEHTLRIAWPIDENGYGYSTEMDLITVRVECEQID